MSGSTEWKTPPAFFRRLWLEFHFTVDAAATAENALVQPHRDGCPEALHPEDRPGLHCPACCRFIGRYWTEEMDALAQDWGGERVYCNPPYSPQALLYRFVEKAAVSARRDRALVVMLLNASSTDTRWFHRFVWDAELHRPRGRVELRLLAGRLRFHGELGTPLPNPRYPNMLVVFRPGDEGLQAGR